MNARLRHPRRDEDIELAGKLEFAL